MADPRQRMRELLPSVEYARACAADVLCDRHPADAVAFTIVESDLTHRDLTFRELREQSARVATGLAQLGVGRGDRVATLMGKSGELVVAMLAIWRLGAIHVPLFTAFAPPAISARVRGNDTKAIITDAQQRHKLAPSAELPADRPWHVVTTGLAADGDVAFEDLLAADPYPRPVADGGDTTLVELYTSGTTGPPKAVPIPLRAIASFAMYQEFGLDHQPDDVFWNAADPGWAYGLYFAVIGPMALGRSSLLLNSGFSPELTWAVLASFGVTNFTASPTVYRALRNNDQHRPARLELRHCSSAGEPLNPDIIAWAQSNLGVPILDHYGQTELGMAAANAWHPALRTSLRTGSMGRALPGWQLDVLRADSDEVTPAGELGRLAVDRAGSPLMWFTGYRGAPELSAERFTADERWYLTGDTARRDSDGHIYFAARDDDVILMAGYRIGPFDVESVLVQHEDVAEAAVVGVPDDLRGEVLAAYVVPRPGVNADDRLASELQQLVKTRFAAHAYPRQVHFVAALPKTPSGKVQRYLLRQHRSTERAGR